MLYLNQNISAAVAAALVTGLVVGLHSIRDIDPILEANVEALSRGESGQKYNNAKSVYCSKPEGAIGCKGALFRNCTGVFCIE